MGWKVLCHSRFIWTCRLNLAHVLQNAQRTGRMGRHLPSSFTLVAGSGDTDNASFSILGDQLKIAESFDYETKDEYSIRVKGTDAVGLSVEKVFTINVSDLNEAPFPVVLEPAEIEENKKVGTVVGRVSVSDPDRSDKVTLVLAEDDDTVDNEKFVLSGSSLKTTEILDHDTTPELVVKFIATDKSGLVTETLVTVTVTNVNEPPTDISLSPNTIAENLPAGTEVGVLTTVDADMGALAVRSSLPDTLSEGLVAYYPFNGNANDESGMRTTERCMGATLVEDRFGGAKRMSFDGKDDWITGALRAWSMHSPK